MKNLIDRLRTISRKKIRGAAFLLLALVVLYQIIHRIHLQNIIDTLSSSLATTLALLLLFLGAIGTAILSALNSDPQERFTNQWWASWLQGLSTEFVGAVVTAILFGLVVGAVQSREAQVQRQTELIRQMQTQDNATALLAIGEVSANGWLEDGTLAQRQYEHADWSNAVLADAGLQGSRLNDIDFESAIANGINLSQTNMVNIDFQNAALGYADFQEAWLHDGDFRNAWLQEANFKDATLLNSTFADARDLSDVQLVAAKMLYHTVMPNGRMYDGRFNLEADIGFAETLGANTSEPEEMAHFYGISTSDYLAGQRWARNNLQELKQESIEWYSNWPHPQDEENAAG